MDKLKEFKELIEKMNSFNKAVSLFHWDMATEAPKKSVADKADVIGMLDTEAFNILTSDKMKECLETLEKTIEDLNEVDAKLVEFYRKEYDKNAKIPEDEYKEFSILAAKSTAVWEEAKGKSNFDLYKPYLEKIVEYKKKFVNYRGYEKHPYNTLLDDFEPGMTVEKLDKFFDTLKKDIVPLLNNINQSNKIINDKFVRFIYPKEGQKEFSDYLLGKIGYDKERGIIKESEHPFTLELSTNDVRITTHYYENYLLSAVYSTIHEGGHAIYEQNIDENLIGTTLDTGTSMGIHESQSRFYENVIGRSLGFWKVNFHKLQKIFKEQLQDVTVEQMYEAANIVKPSLIRIEADELTYALHIMVRYEIEKQLINGDIEVKDLPTIWNKLMSNYLGVIPTNDAEGVLQDIHWSDGSFGYFPSYALGNAYAAQFLATMNKEFDVDKCMENDELDTIKNWLNDKIHKYGRLLEPNEIIKNVTGEELNAKYLVEYLKQKYENIYNLN